MTEDIYSKLNKQSQRYCRRQFIDDIKLLRKRQKELAQKDNSSNPKNYFEKKRKKRKLINIIKLPSSNTNSENLKHTKRKILQRNETMSNEYFEKQRLQNKNKLAKISNNYKYNAPSKLTIPKTSQIDTQQIKIKIKTPNKVKRCSPRNKYFKFNNKYINTQFPQSQNNFVKPKINRIKTQKINKRRLVSPMYFKRYNNYHNEIKDNQIVKNKILKARSNQKKRIPKKTKFKTRKINLNNETYDIDTNIIREKLKQMSRSSVVNILVKENLVERTTRAPKKLLIDLLLTTKIHYINVLKEL